MPPSSLAAALLCVRAALGASSAQAAGKCPVAFDQLKKALKAAVKPGGGPSNGGLDNNEWAAVVTRDGTICALTFSGEKATDQWPGSRAIAAEKAFTANGLSLERGGSLDCQPVGADAVRRLALRPRRQVGRHRPMCSTTVRRPTTAPKTIR